MSNLQFLAPADLRNLRPDSPFQSELDCIPVLRDSSLEILLCCNLGRLVCSHHDPCDASVEHPQRIPQALSKTITVTNDSPHVQHWSFQITRI